MKLKSKLLALWLAAVGLMGTSAYALDLPPPNCGLGPFNNCITFNDFNVYSLPLLNMQAGFGEVPGPGDPYYVPSNNGTLNQFTVIGRNNGQDGAGNVAGIDGAYNTPGTQPGTFSTQTTADPGGAGEFTGDQAGSWDATVSNLLALTQGTPLVGFMGFSETGSNTGLESTDLLIWISVTLCDTSLGGVGCDKTFYLGGSSSGINGPSIAAGDLPAADGSDSDGTNGGVNAPGFGDWVYVHGAICVAPNGAFFGFPDSSGACPVGSSPKQQNQTGQNNGTFMINSPAMDSALDSGVYDYINLIWKMAYINGNGEWAWFQSVSTVNNAPEPATLALLGLGLLGVGFAGMRRRKV